jgi:hypothetical protein
MSRDHEGKFQHGKTGKKNPPVNPDVVREPKLKTGGNAKCDQAWLEELEDEIHEMTPEETKALKLPWDVKYRWSGYAEELNADFFEDFRRGTRRCNGAAYVRDERGGYIIDADANRIMRPCLGLVLLGGNVCQKHGGQIGHVKRAAEIRLAMASENAATTLIELSGPLDVLGVPVEQAQRIKAANSVLDRVGIRPGMEVTIDNKPGYQALLDELFSDAAKE